MKEKAANISGDRNGPMGQVWPALVVLSLVIALCGCTGQQKQETSAELPGTSWELQTYGTPAARQEVLAGTEVTLTFDESGSISGNAGCNRYQGPFRRGETDSLSFGLVASTKMMCGEPPGVMEQEMAFLRSLEKVQTFLLKDGALELRCEDGSVLSFKQATAPH